MKTVTITGLSVMPLTPSQHGAWDRFAAESDTAWFWHTTAWLTYARAFTAERFMDDLSFMIYNGPELCAICPVFLEEEYGIRRFACVGEPLPFPAYKPGLGAGAQCRVLDLYIETLARLAEEHQAAYVSVRVPPVAAASRENAALPVNPLLPYGFFDLTVLTQVVDLRQPRETLWAQIRKGHKSDIKRGGKSCAVTVWDQATITLEKFRQYQELHRKDAGRATRSQRTFDLMLDWVRDGQAMLTEAHIGDRPIAFALVMRFGVGAYYGSGCKDPDHLSVPASHLIQWEAMLWLKAHGTQFYDLGLQHLAPQWFHVPTAKELGISSFKRGFGGMTVPLATAERFYALDYLKETFARRMEAHVSSSRV
ncbi:MAG: GNAT family N-acetyltransferase [Candidatus Omnitrophica bacterium]|nr:GNAT family N-acetyltransferase [Candidatus Omnitrophota bacterium]